jgi:hypothetical protein
MIIIAILYGCIIGFEWRYLNLKRRKPRTYRYVLGSAVLLFLCFETLHAFRDQWTIAEAIQLIFDPIERIVRMEK